MIGQDMRHDNLTLRMVLTQLCRAERMAGASDIFKRQTRVLLQRSLRQMRDGEEIAWDVLLPTELCEIWEMVLHAHQHRTG